MSDLEVVVLTPETIPDYASKTGRSEKALMVEYLEAKDMDKVMYGCIIPAPYWQDYISIG